MKPRGPGRPTSASRRSSFTSAPSRAMRRRWSPTRVAGFPLGLNIMAGSDWIDPAELSGAAAAIIQVDADNAASIKRFQKLAQAVATPLIAAAYEPPLALVRSLVRAGAHDVIPLPLSLDELETSLGPIRDELDEAAQRRRAPRTPSWSASSRASAAWARRRSPASLRSASRTARPGTGAKPA